MKWLLLAWWVCSVWMVTGQQTVLPFVKNGKWSIIDSTGRELVKTDYSYIHSFDETGLTFFCHKGAYGIMDGSGKVLAEPLYADIVQVGNGHYRLSTKKGWIRFSPVTMQVSVFDSTETFEPLSAVWALSGNKDSLFLEHLSTGRKWAFADSVARYRIVYDHAVFDQSDSISLLLDETGTERMRGKLLLAERNGLCDISFRKQHYLLDAKGRWSDQEVTQVEFRTSTVFVKTKTAAILYGYDRKEWLRGAYDDISELNEKYLEVRKDGLLALVDRKTNRVALPYRYENIWVLNNDGYQVFLDGNTGLLDSSFREIIPCKYQRYSLEGDLARVNEFDYWGLYSLKTRKEILPPVYNTITRTGWRFKAQRNELITIIELNEAHKVLRTAKIDQVITVRNANKAGGQRKRVEIDARLFALGWFLDSTLVVPKEGDAYYSLKWGLRNEQDSVLIRPSLQTLFYVPGAPYTMMKGGLIDYEFSAGRKTTVLFYKSVYLPKGKVRSSETILAYDSLDFKMRSFMRVATTETFGILKEDGEFQQLTYVEKGANEYLRYCFSEKAEVTEKEVPDMTECPTMCFNNGRFERLEHPLLRKHRGKPAKGFVYPEGKWNFLAPSGKPLLKDTFSFVHPFVGNNAIVRKGKLWGVVDPDTVLIPMMYSGVERKIVVEDTFFVVQRSVSGVRLLDTNSRELREYAVVASKGNLLIIEEGGQKFLYDAGLRKLSEGYTSMKFRKDGLILAKTKKEFTLLGSEGEVLFSGADPPEMVLSRQLLAFEKAGGYYLTDANMNVLYPYCSSVEERGAFVVIRIEGKTAVLNRNGTLLLENISGKLFVDTLENHFAVLDKEKLRVYDNNGQRIAKNKGLVPDYFIRGRFLVNTKDSCTLYTETGVLQQVLPALDELKVLQNGSVFISTKGRYNCLFDKSWNRVLPGETKFRQLSAIHQDVYAFQNGSGKTVLFNVLTGAMDSSFRLTGSNFSNNRLLVQRAKGFGFLYIDAHFKPITVRTFTRAIPFTGNYAAVADVRGWALIDHDCNQLTYPNYGAVTALNESVFQTAKLPLYGVFDVLGKEIIPVQYEQIRFLTEGYILAIREGEYYYFRLDGTRLFTAQ